MCLACSHSFPEALAPSVCECGRPRTGDSICRTLRLRRMRKWTRRWYRGCRWWYVDSFDSPRDTPDEALTVVFLLRETSKDHRMPSDLAPSRAASSGDSLPPLFTR